MIQSMSRLAAPRPWASGCVPIRQMASVGQFSSLDRLLLIVMRTDRRLVSKLSEARLCISDPGIRLINLPWQRDIGYGHCGGYICACQLPTNSNKVRSSTLRKQSFVVVLYILVFHFDEADQFARIRIDHLLTYAEWHGVVSVPAIDGAVHSVLVHFPRVAVGRRVTAAPKGGDVCFCVCLNISIFHILNLKFHNDAK